MAEIAEIPEKDAVGAAEVDDREPFEPEFDPKTMRRTEPGVKRLLITLSFLLGLPFLYKSVEIYRSPLPFRDIDSLTTRLESEPLTFPFNFRAFFVGFDFNRARLQYRISEKIDKLTQRRPQCGSADYTLDVTVYSRLDRFAAIDFDHAEGDDVDELLRAVLEGRGEYSVVVVRGENEKAVVGKYRHAWMVVREVEAAAAAERVAEVLVNVFVNGGREDGSVRSEFMPVGADGRVVLSFSLLNADARDWFHDWDFEMIDQNVLAPMVNTLGSVANISVESQVLYHTPKASFSYWDQKFESYVFGRKDLPFFVNSNEWHLDTSIAAGGHSKILHFVICTICRGVSSPPSAFRWRNFEDRWLYFSMWGVVVVWNPKNCSNEQKDKYKYTSRHPIPLEDLQNIFEVFMGQLRQLLGLNSIEQYVGKTGIWNLLLSERGFLQTGKIVISTFFSQNWMQTSTCLTFITSPKELDVLTRQHTCFNLHSCATTLGSLSRLVQSLPRMIIMDEIGKQVKFSLEAANLAQNNASDGLYDASSASSSKLLNGELFIQLPQGKHDLSQRMHFSTLLLCRFVVQPFFLPVAMHVVLSALREIRRFKRERVKYAAWMTKLKVSS